MKKPKSILFIICFQRKRMAPERKIIRNAPLEIMARDASALYKNIVDFGTGLGGKRDMRKNRLSQKGKTINLVNLP